MGHPGPLTTTKRAPVGAIVATVLLMIASGAAGLFSLIVLPFASDGCGDSDTQLICTAGGQQAVALVPLMAAVVGTVIAACSCGLRPPRRAAGIGLGYVIGFGGFITALIIASQV